MLPLSVEEPSVAASDFPQIRRVLSAAVRQALEDGHSVVDGDDLIESLLEHFPDGLPVDDQALRAEIVLLASKHGLGVKE